MKSPNIGFVLRLSFLLTALIAASGQDLAAKGKASEKAPYFPPLYSPIEKLLDKPNNLFSWQSYKSIQSADGTWGLVSIREESAGLFKLIGLRDRGRIVWWRYNQPDQLNFAGYIDYLPRGLHFTNAKSEEIGFTHTTGGSICCRHIWLFAGSPRPRLLRVLSFASDYGSLLKSPSGRTVIAVSDGAFLGREWTWFQLPTLVLTVEADGAIRLDPKAMQSEKPGSASLFESYPRLSGPERKERWLTPVRIKSLLSGSVPAKAGEATEGVEGEEEAVEPVAATFMKFAYSGQVNAGREFVEQAIPDATARKAFFETFVPLILDNAYAGDLIPFMGPSLLKLLDSEIGSKGPDLLDRLLAATPSDKRPKIGVIQVGEGGESGERTSIMWRHPCVVNAVGSKLSFFKLNGTLIGEVPLDVCPDHIYVVEDGKGVIVNTWASGANGWKREYFQLSNLMDDREKSSFATTRKLSVDARRMVKLRNGRTIEVTLVESNDRSRDDGEPLETDCIPNRVWFAGLPNAKRLTEEDQDEISQLLKAERVDPLFTPKCYMPREASWTDWLD